MWRKRRKESEVQSVVAQKIGSGVSRAKEKWAGFMNRQDAKCTTRQKKMALLLFCLVFAGSSGWILVDTFLPGESVTPDILPGPATTQLPSLPSTGFLVPLSKTDTINLLRLCDQLDSLRLTPGGKEQIEQFSKTHPGLLDKLSELQKSVP